MSINSPTPLIATEQQGSVLVITINNPPANTWTIESLNGLKSVVEQAEESGEIVAIVVYGQGEKFFSAGADLKQFSGGDKAYSKEVAEAFGEAFEALASFSGVTIAAINGYAMGGGLECALACDIRIAEEHAQLALPEAKVGLLPCAGGTQRLSWLVGEAWASRIILLGERIDAERALTIGLAQETTAKGAATARAIELAKQTAEQSPDAIRACKRLMTAPREKAIAQGLIDERSEFIDLIGEANQLEGTNAFLEKRSPSWS
ncbi:enoyl-CoA hydratase [Oleiphilus sp. HI0125]|uniref:enoyl-CoA hydratase n=1 Tax=Oleiphilus sp. HI0125 TaxID=1822266 RepID=UPI0007C2D5AB|nr:enoyl-CoA hydratase [Oleiphilus sp. HI0125]KZZ57224.1 enoyl-CoA hydratase [Oleiphilus sp. HI0125]